MSTSSDPQQQSSTAPEEAPAREITRVQVKIPPFWRESPELWFIKIESQFVTAGITSDSTQYHTVVAALDNQFAMAISDIIRNPPAVDKYKMIKQRLISVYADSQQKKLKKMLREISLGDMKPSQLARQMVDLAGTQMTEDAIKTIWLERLSEIHPSISAVLSIVTGTLSVIAEQADKMADLAGNNQTIAPVSAQPNLSAQIEALTKAIEHLNRGRSESKGNRSSSRDRSKSKNKYDTCWYHYKFKEKAKKCADDGSCKYKKN